MPRKTRAFFIDERRQLRALASPVRQEIVDVLCELGPVAVSELALTLDRPADALYYHLRALLKSALVVRAGHRLFGNRKEELFRSVSPDLRLRYQMGPDGNGREIGTLVGSMLRIGTRDFTRAFQQGRARVSGAGRELWALRRTGWLTARQIVALNRSLARMADAVSKPRGKGRLYAITFLLTPVDRAGRGRGGAGAGPRRLPRLRTTP